MWEDRRDSDKLLLTGRAEAAIDARLADVWGLAWEAGDPVPAQVVAGLMRLAYATGYRDATEEPAPGALYRTLGLRKPVSRAGPDAAPRGNAPGLPGSSGT